MLKKIISSLILLFWFTMLGILIERTYLRPSHVIALDQIAEEGVRARDDWHGIYQQGRKIGFAHITISREADTYRISEESELDLLVLGSVQRIGTKINSYTTRNFLLKYFDFELTSKLSSMKIKGAVVKNQLVLDIQTGGQSRSERIPLKEPPYLSPNVKPSLVLLGLESGKKYRFPVFNPATMSTEDAFVVVEAKEKIKIGDRDLIVYKLRETFQGMEAFSWITEDGDTIKEESPLGYVLLKETRTEALKRDKAGPAVDILSLVMIHTKPIENPASVRYLLARLSGLTLEDFQLDGDRQAMRIDRIEVRVSGSAMTYPLPYSGQGMNDLLQATALIQSDDTKIMNQARKIIGSDRDARTAAAKLNSWVYEAIEKKPVVSIPSALAVLQERVGDCNEHTTLYTALARASGIPTRMASGIVYMKEGFYYHAWPEVWLGEWVAIDPTFNQFPADATHIRFVIGDLSKQADILRLIGKLQVDVLEYK